MINDGWHVLQRILIKGTMFLLKVISAGLNGWKKKKKKTCKSWSTNFMSFYYIQLLLILVRNIIMPGEYIIYDNIR